MVAPPHVHRELRIVLLEDDLKLALVIPLSQPAGESIRSDARPLVGLQGARQERVRLAPLPRVGSEEELCRALPPSFRGAERLDQPFPLGLVQAIGQKGTETVGT